MDNKTRVFDSQFEIALLRAQLEILKQEIEALKRNQPTYWPTYQPPSVPGYPPQPPIFGPGDLNWWKIVSSAETPQAIKDLFQDNNKENK